MKQISHAGLSSPIVCGEAGHRPGTPAGRDAVRELFEDIGDVLNTRLVTINDTPITLASLLVFVVAGVLIVV